MDPFTRVDFNYGQILSFLIFGSFVKTLLEFLKFLLVLGLAFVLGIAIFQFGNEVAPQPRNSQTPPRNSAGMEYPHVIEIPLKLSEENLTIRRK